jgi:hypothetical protein
MSLALRQLRRGGYERALRRLKLRKRPGCGRCHQGQFPVDVELDIVDAESSPGVRRMHALVGQEAPFDHGREQMKVLAGLEVTTKAVERTAEAIGGDIAQRQQQQEIEHVLIIDDNCVYLVLLQYQQSADRMPNAPLAAAAATVLFS